MIKTLYPTFRHWSERGGVYIISDTHFEDSDCKLMDENWITPEEHISNINRIVHKNDTLIHLGDVGNPEWMKKIKAYKVLITGNHDRGVSYYEEYFDEIYDGPLFVANKLLLSHEPVFLEFAFNIHGHDHNKMAKRDGMHLNCASNVVGYEPINLANVIKEGVLSGISSIHRLTIDYASGRINKDEEKNVSM